MSHPLGRLAVAAMILAMGCGGPTVDRPPDPLAQAVERSGEAVEGAIERARDTESGQSEVTFRARYNPVTCDCPEWEVKFRGRWVRVDLRSEPEVTPLLEQLWSRALDDYQQGLWATYYVVGFVGPERVEASTGMEYPAFWLQAPGLVSP